MRQVVPWGFPALTYNYSELQTLPFITDNGVVIRENCVLHSSCVSLTLHGAEWVCVCTQVQVKGRWMAHSYSMQWHCSVCMHSATEPSCGDLITKDRQEFARHIKQEMMRDVCGDVWCTSMTMTLFSTIPHAICERFMQTKQNVPFFHFCHLNMTTVQHWELRVMKG